MLDWSDTLIKNMSLGEICAVLCGNEVTFQLQYDRDLMCDWCAADHFGHLSVISIKPNQNIYADMLCFNQQCYEGNGLRREMG